MGAIKWFELNIFPVFSWEKAHWEWKRARALAHSFIRSLARKRSNTNANANTHSHTRPIVNLMSENNDGTCRYFWWINCFIHHSDTFQKWNITLYGSHSHVHAHISSVWRTCIHTHTTHSVIIQIKNNSMWKWWWRWVRASKCERVNKKKTVCAPYQSLAINRVMDEDWLSSVKPKVFITKTYLQWVFDKIAQFLAQNIALLIHLTMTLIAKDWLATLSLTSHSLSTHLLNAYTRHRWERELEK